MICADDGRSLTARRDMHNLFRIEELLDRIFKDVALKRSAHGRDIHYGGLLYHVALVCHQWNLIATRLMYYHLYINHSEFNIRHFLRTIPGGSYPWKAKSGEHCKIVSLVYPSREDEEILATNIWTWLPHLKVINSHEYPLTFQELGSIEEYCWKALERLDVSICGQNKDVYRALDSIGTMQNLRQLSLRVPNGEAFSWNIRTIWNMPYLVSFGVDTIQNRAQHWLLGDPLSDNYVAYLFRADFPALKHLRLPRLHLQSISCHLQAFTARHDGGRQFDTVDVYLSKDTTIPLIEAFPNLKQLGMLGVLHQEQEYEEQLTRRAIECAPATLECIVIDQNPPFDRSTNGLQNGP
ncbi:hypothetical protein CALVIDRAFT_415713 [Calocera viscosa TUFC12733]|uniref:F-box domain-containing protein n=1 Tax=Calocera viscosa (strain TUFC12733) TaxID=1330018 RepID=A0A167G051_CALVF|nr:hypothetical protein CALVIDRAFT_415713 [Calocera viscosa TUFC12733]